MGQRYHNGVVDKARTEKEGEIPAFPIIRLRLSPQGMP